MAHLSPQTLLESLAALGIKTETFEHPAVFTVEQSRPVKAGIPGAHSKNLFVKDKKGRLFLITARDETAIDLKRLHAAIGASGRLSFGSAEQLWTHLGVEPGSVTPFAIANDRSGAVTMILDANLMEHELMNFHPLVNTMTTGGLARGPAAVPALDRTRAGDPATARACSRTYFCSGDGIAGRPHRSHLMRLHPQAAFEAAHADR